MRDLTAIPTWAKQLSYILSEIVSIGFVLGGIYTAEEKKIVQEILFPEGIVYDKENDTFRTSQVNKVIELIASISNTSENKKEGQVINSFDLSPPVARRGVEPLTSGL